MAAEITPSPHSSAVILSPSQRKAAPGAAATRSKARSIFVRRDTTGSPSLTLSVARDPFHQPLLKICDILRPVPHTQSDPSHTREKPQCGHKGDGEEDHPGHEGGDGDRDPDLLRPFVERGQQ